VGFPGEIYITLFAAPVSGFFVLPGDRRPVSRIRGFFLWFRGSRRRTRPRRRSRINQRFLFDPEEIIYGFKEPRQKREYKRDPPAEATKQDQDYGCFHQNSLEDVISLLSGEEEPTKLL